MAFEIKQTLKLGQHLVMTPQLQQAIKLLQLSRMELAHFRQNAMGNDMMRAAVGSSVGSSAPRAPALNSGLTTDQNI